MKIQNLLPNEIAVPSFKKLLRQTNRSKKYKNISQDARNQIIHKLTKEKLTLKQVSDEFSLKPSTVKAIIKVYQEEGRIGKKSTRERKIKIMNTVVLALTDEYEKYLKLSTGNITPFTMTDSIMSDIFLDNKNPQNTENTLEEFSLKQNATVIRQLYQNKKKKILPQFQNQQALNNFLNQYNFLEQNPSEFQNQMKKSTIDNEILQNIQLTEEERVLADKIYEVLRQQEEPKQSQNSQEHQ